MISLGQTTVDLNFPPTQVIRVDGQLYDYRGRARDKQRRHIFEADNRLRVDFSDREILSLQHERKLEILGHAEAESARLVGEKRKPRPNFNSATPEDRAKVERLLNYIREWEARGCPPRTREGLAPLIRDVADKTADQAWPSPRTLCRKLALWIKSGGDVNPLPATSMCGNTHDRLDPGMKAAFRELIEKYSLADVPETVVGAHALAKFVWKEKYQHLPGGAASGLP